MSFYLLTPQDMMIVLDDLALPCGRLRLLGELKELREHRRRMRALSEETDLAAWCVETRY